MQRREPGIVVHGPFGGLNEIVDAKLIGDRELAAASNVVLRGGRIAPRPGYAAARAYSFGRLVTTVLSNASYTTNVRGLACEDTDQYVYFNQASAVAADNKLFRRSYDGTVLQTILVHTADGSGAQVDVNLDVVMRIRVHRKAANNIDVYFWQDFGGVGTLRKTNWNGAAWGASSLVYDPAAAGQTSVADAPFDLDIVNDRLWLVENDAAGHANISTVILTTLVHAVWYDYGSAQTLWDLRYYNDYLYYMRGAAPSYLYRTPTSAYSATQLATTVAVRVVVEQTDNKLLVLTALTAGSLIRRCNLDGTSTEVFSNDPRVGGLWFAGDWTNTGYLIVNNNTDDTMYSMMTGDVATQHLVSSAWIERSQLGVGSDFSRDIVLAQILSSSGSYSRLVAWFPASDDVYHLLNGYRYFAGTTRHSLVINSRDTLPGDGTALSAKSGRMSFQWQGVGINTGWGGMICADGDEDSDSPYCFNYVLGDSIWAIAETSGAGTVSATFLGETTATWAWNASDQTVRDVLQALDAIDAARVVRTGAGPYTWTIRFYGAWGGQNTPAMTAAFAAGATGTCTQTQSGGTDTDSWLYLRPCNLPVPIRRVPYASGEAVTPAVGFEVVREVAAGVLSGVYSYVVTYYSTRWNIESKPSGILGEKNTIYDPELIVVDGDTHRIYLHCWTIPVNLYFNRTTVPFYHIDRMRIYRRRWGDQMTAADIPDGVGASDTWRFVAEIDISTRSIGIQWWIDDVPDDAIVGNTPAPFENGYPPKNANFVTLHQGRAYYASQTPGDSNLWISELSKKGGISNGELGYEYVAENSFNTVPQLAASDCPFTALYGDFGPNLIIGTPTRTLRAFLTQQFLGAEILNVEPIMGAPGIASHWMVARGQGLPDSPPVLFWVSPLGHVYAFDGAQATRISSGFSPTGYLSAYHRRYWNIGTSFDAGFDNSWYYGTLVVDPERQLLIAQGWQSGAGACMVFSLDGARGWTTWALNGHGWVLGRDPTTGVARIYFGMADCKLAYLSDGAADNGTSFAWSYRTKAFNAENLLMKKHWREFVLMFNRRNFSGAAGAVTLKPYLNGYQVAALNASTTLTEDTTPPTDDIAQASVMVGQLAKHLQLEVSGTQAASQSHAELAALFVEFVPEGLARERR